MTQYQRNLLRALKNNQETVSFYGPHYMETILFVKRIGRVVV